MKNKLNNVLVAGEVTLYIQAFSDKNPIFAPPWTPSRPQLQVKVKEEQEPGTKVFSIIAKDPISGEVKQLLNLSHTCCLSVCLSIPCT